MIINLEAYKTKCQACNKIYNDKTDQNISLSHQRTNNSEKMKSDIKIR